MIHPNRVFITGATGSIGFALAQRLRESGQAVRALVRNPDRAERLRSLPGVEISPGDLGQPDSLRGCLEGCARVYHCAAKLLGSDRAAFQAINVVGTQALVQEAARSGVERFILLSTNAVYGLGAARNISEDFPLPKSEHPYITTKQGAERIVQAAAPQIGVTIARLGDVFGPGQFAWTVQFIEKINQGILHPPLKKDAGIMNPIYIENLIDALVLMGIHPAASGQVFNVVDGEPIWMDEYILRLARMAGKQPFALPGSILKGVAALLKAADLVRGREAVVTPDSVQLLVRRVTINGDKIHRTLGWKPAIPQEEAFRRTEAWLRQEGYLTNPP